MSIYEEKIEFFKTVLDDVIKGINYYNNLNIITINDYNNAQEAIEKTTNLINTINFMQTETKRQLI
jgi:hypothetical protein